VKKIDIIPGAYNFISMICGSEVEARIYHGENEVCKTESEALEAAELLKAFFEAKQEGKDYKKGLEAFLMAQEWQEGYAEGFKNGYDNSNEDAKQLAILEARQAQPQPSDYQLRLERYAVDIYQMDEVESADDAVNRAAKIIANANKKAREQ